MNPVPVMLTSAPTVSPEPGVTAVIVGAGPKATYVYVFDPRPFTESTLTLTSPAAWGGATTVRELSDKTSIENPGTTPKYTASVPVKPVPVRATTLPPVVLPAGGLTSVMVGRGPGATKVNWSAEPVALVPLGVVTVTSTGPAPSGGESTVRVVSETTSIDVPGWVPKSTAVAPVNPVPESSTGVPPAVAPPPGLTPVTVGADAAAAVPAMTMELVRRRALAATTRQFRIASMTL